MKQHTEYKPQSNFISTISIKQKYQDAYKEMRSKCHKYKISQGDVIMYGYSELLEKIPREEISRHETLLKRILQKIDKDAELTIAGSYRRRCVPNHRPDRFH